MNAFYVVLKFLVLPPGVLVLAFAVSLIVMLRWRRLGKALVLVTVIALWALSTPLVAAILAHRVEIYPPIDIADVGRQQLEAIVVLGGGPYQNAPEFADHVDVSRLTLERLRYAARLHRQTRLDIAVTGGMPFGVQKTEGEMMRASLEQDFGVPVRWVENESRDTAENARFTARKFRFRRIILVTHAVHMPRAVKVFEGAGFTVTPAPMGYIAGGYGAFTWWDLLPGIGALYGTHYALYEQFGAIWYALNSSKP